MGGQVNSAVKFIIGIVMYSYSNRHDIFEALNEQ
jgi:hypothetical protein